MRRFLPPPAFVIGCYLGMALTLLIVGVVSYQDSHCEKIQQAAVFEPNLDNPTKSAPQSEDQEKEKEVTEYAKSHPVTCGIVGIVVLIPFTVGYMDHHEGFFVGLFTLALFFATGFLWRSTDKLYDAGERQIKLSRDVFTSTNRAWIKIKSAKIGNGIEYDEFGDLYGSISLDFENVGSVPALNVQMIGGLSINGRHERIWKQAIANMERASPAGGFTLFPGEVYPEIVGHDRNDLSLLANRIDVREAMAKPPFDGAIFLNVIGAVFYATPSDTTKYRRTPFRYMIYKSKLPIEIRPVEGDILPTELELHRMPSDPAN